MNKTILVVFFVAACALSWMAPADICAGDKPEKDPAENIRTNPGDSLPKIDSGEEKPAIFFPESSHDFGDASQRTSLIHTFKVQNKGDAPLIIDKVSAS